MPHSLRRKVLPNALGRCSLTTAEVNLRTGQQEQRQDHDTPFRNGRNRVVLARNIRTGLSLVPNALLEGSAAVDRGLFAATERALIAASAEDRIAIAGGFYIRTAFALVPALLGALASTGVDAVSAGALQELAASTGNL